MPRQRKLKLGKDAVVSCLSKYIHPSEHIRRRWPNPINGHRMEGLRVLRQEIKRVSRKDQLAVVFTHPEFKDDNNELLELHTIQRWLTVTEEGESDYFFDTNSNGNNNANTEIVERTPEEQVEVPVIAQQNNRAETLDMNDPYVLEQLRGIASIDDDNEPVQDNIPGFSPDNECQYKGWGFSGVCNRRQNGGGCRGANLKNHNVDLKLTKLQLWEILFPTKWVKEVMLVQMNKKMERSISYGEWLRFIGIWLEIATTVGFERRKFWADGENESGSRMPPYCYNGIMPRDRFESILTNLVYTKKDPPTYKDRFWEVREMLAAWNTNMANEFRAGWMTCLDESMSKWVNKYTCPGYMVVPRKPWPFGNEYHTICCAISGILFALELVEGKDKPRERPNPEHSELGKMAGLMMRLTETLRFSNDIVICDSGFCVLKGVASCKKFGVNLQAMIKKRRYWPKYILGDMINAHFVNKEVGYFDMMKLTLDGEDLCVHAMKEDGYVLSFMSSFGTGEQMGGQQQRIVKEEDGTEKRATFQYPEVVHNHYAYRDAVDNHNGRRMFPIAIEEQLKTHRWPNRVFQFLLAVTEVNANYGMHYFYGSELEEQVDFRFTLAQEMKFNPYLTAEAGSRSCHQRVCTVVDTHDHLSIPRFKTFRGTQLVPCRTQYIQRNCICGKPNMCHYCSCSPGTIRCKDCFKKHILEVNQTL